MFDKLQEHINKAISGIKSKNKITEFSISESIEKIRLSLLDADVNFKVAQEFTKKVKEKSLGKEILNSLKPDEIITKILYDELTKIMGGHNIDINFLKNPTIILIIGLQGSGKTTFSGKLSYLLSKKKNKKPLLVAADIYRPAAINQLKTLGLKINIPVFSIENSKDPINIIEESIKYGKNNFHDVIIVDTAGRISTDELMMNEIKTIFEKVKPDETLFLIDCMTGQSSIKTAKIFNKIIDYQGVVLTKFDGDAKGGIALNIYSELNKPIKFISKGEKLEEIDIFYPKRMASRIIGMGDIITLVEKVKEQFNNQQSEKLYKKLSNNNFNLNDFLKQINKIKKMGNIKDLLDMIPGINKITKNLELKNNFFKKIESIIYSMTQEERENPKIINTERKKRIANGSSSSIEEVDNLLQQFEEMSNLIKKMQNNSKEEILKNISNYINKNKNF